MGQAPFGGRHERVGRGVSIPWDRAPRFNWCGETAPKSMQATEVFRLRRSLPYHDLVRTFVMQFTQHAFCL